MNAWKILRSYGVSPWRYKLLYLDLDHIIVKHRWKSTVEYIEKGEKTNG